MLELGQAMGLSKPSIYAAFGDKEALYLKALDSYLAQHIARHVAVLDGVEDGREAVARFLASVAGMMADPALPGGCFIINGSADLGGSTIPPMVETALRAARQGSESKLNDRLLRAQRDGQLGADVNAANLAALFAAVLAGLGVLAKTGAPLEKLDTVITLAMQAWPTGATTLH